MNANKTSRRMTAALTIASACCGSLLPVSHAIAQAAAQAPDPTIFYRADGWTMRWHLQAGVNAVAEQKLFWNLAATTSPGTGYDPSKAWLELYVKPGVSAERSLAGGAVLYGKLSAVASATRGTDAFETTNGGRVTLEEAHAGLRGQWAGGMSYDVSVGPRELRLGTGMSAPTEF